MNHEEAVLVSLRRIVRALDLHSNQLNKRVSLTTPQLLLLRLVDELGAVSISQLSSEMSLSQATVTSIIKRMEARGLVTRHRSERDKRVVNAALTSAGRELLGCAPKPLQEVFSNRFADLEDWEQSMIVAALQRVAGLMNADDIDAAPVLHLSGDMVAAPEASGATEPTTT